ncbi:MAG: nucleotidyltransferase domain-containing protein [Thermodesulfobacteriota bacterium]
MDDTLKEIVNRIVREADPDKIILFGSRVKGSEREWSDYDLCVLKSGVVHRRRLAQRLYRKLFGVKAFVDVIVETPERFNELKDKWFLIYSDIADSGSIIYEK